MKDSHFPLSDIPALLAQGMGAELHWFPEDVQPLRLAAVLVGMANTKGGIILLAIVPCSGQAHGLKDPNETLERIFQAALLSDPPLILPVPRLYNIQQARSAGNHGPGGVTERLLPGRPFSGTGRLPD